MVVERRGAVEGGATDRADVAVVVRIPVAGSTAPRVVAPHHAAVRRERGLLFAPTGPGVEPQFSYAAATFCRPMPDRVPSDHPTVTTYDATVARQGRTDRPKVVLPADADLPAGEVVRLVLDGSEYRARLDRPTTGDGLEIRGAYDTPAAARDPGSAPNRLVEWVEDVGLAFGRTVHLDEVESGFRYGLRAPGERAVYEATGGPDESLAGIAERVERNDS